MRHHANQSKHSEPLTSQQQMQLRLLSCSEYVGTYDLKYPVNSDEWTNMDSLYFVRIAAKRLHHVGFDALEIHIDAPFKRRKEQKLAGAALLPMKYRF